MTVTNTSVAKIILDYGFDIHIIKEKTTAQILYNEHTNSEFALLLCAIFDNVTNMNIVYIYIYILHNTCRKLSVSIC